MDTIYIMSGLPGSGKSTWVRSNLKGPFIASADSYFTRHGVYRFEAAKLPAAHNACWGRFVGLVVRKCPTIVVDNTNLTWLDCSRYVLVGLERGYRVVLVRCECSVTEAAARNIHGVGAEHLERMATRVLEIPPDILANPNFYRADT